MISRALKVPQIKMEDRSPFDIGTKNWAPAHGLHSTVKISDSARRSQLLRAGHHRAWHLILICHFKLLEERWANLAQLFTFYWDLTRNKFSFLPNAVLTRSRCLIRFYMREDILDSAKLWQKSLGTLDKIKDDEWDGWKDRKPPGREPLTISPTVKRVILVSFRNY